MWQREHDGLTLAVGLTLLSLGSFIFLDSTGLHDLGDLFYALPADSSPPVLRLLTAQQASAPLWALLLVLTGIGELWRWGDPKMPTGARLAAMWLAWGALVNLLAQRLMAFPAGGRIPWYAILLLAALILAMSVRCWGDLWGLWQRRDV